MLEKQPANCVHTSVIIMISSTQVLFAETCTGVDAGSELNRKYQIELITKSAVPSKIYRDLHNYRPPFELYIMSNY